MIELQLKRHDITMNSGDFSRLNDNTYKLYMKSQRETLFDDEYELLNIYLKVHWYEKLQHKWKRFLRFISCGLFGVKKSIQEIKESCRNNMQHVKVVTCDLNASEHPNTVNGDFPDLSSASQSSLDPEAFKTKVKACKNKTDSNTKPICVYAINTQDDEKGCIMSEKALEFVKYSIAKYRENYHVLPIVFNSKEALNKKLIKYSTKYHGISLLHIRSHGKHIRPWDDGKIEGISNQTQVVIEACETANNPRDIAFKISQENSCEVFAAANKINFAQPSVKIIDDTPKVVSLGAFSRNKVKINSYRIFITQSKGDELKRY